jgi:hypothetical protein
MLTLWVKSSLSRHLARPEGGQKTLGLVRHARGSEACLTRNLTQMVRISRVKFAAVVGGLLLAKGAAATPSTTAVAGLDGWVRASRWVPVYLTVTSAEEDRGTAGDVVVSWGDATVRRRLRFDSSATRRLVLHLRSSAPEALLRVRFENASEVASTIASKTASRIGDTTEVAVHIARDDEPLTVCIVPAATTSETDARCTATLTPDRLPVSARGYDAADDVLWPVGQIALPQAQAQAQWRTLRHLATSGALSLTPQPRRPATRRGLPWASARPLVAASACYLGLLTGLGWWSLRRRLAPAAAGAALAAATGAGCVLTWGAGRVEPFRAVRLTHDSVVQLIPGTPAAVLTMRAIVEVPARGPLDLRFPHTDGNMERVAERGRVESIVDAEGFPSLRGTFGVDERPSFAIEAMIPADLLQVREDSSGVRITNASRYTMQQCEPGEGFVRGGIDTLASGDAMTLIQRQRSRDAASDGEADDSLTGPLITCTFDGLPVALTGTDRRVEPVGRTLVAAFRARPPASEPGVRSRP